MTRLQILIRILLSVIAITLASSQSFSQGEPPWRRPLMICRSSDGVSFSQPEVFQDSSGVPCVIRLQSGDLISAFQWFRQPVGSVTWDRVAVKFSTDNGASWSNPQPVIVNGLPGNYQRPFDPALAVTDDGRIRMYFSSGQNTMLDTSVNTYSAISDDGINYVFDSGIRFSLPDKPVIDPAVIRFRGLWHLVNPVTMGSGAYHNVSGNGLDFNRVADISSDMSHSWIGNFMINDTNELRFYGSGGMIWYSSSPNGGQWSSFVSTNITGGDPSVLKLADSNYIMIYTGPPYPTSIGETDETIDYNLLRNYPNPFNPSTTIVYSVLRAGFVEIRIYDASGKMISSPVHGKHERGSYEFIFSGSGLPSAVYHCTLNLDGELAAVRKLLLLK